MIIKPCCLFHRRRSLFWTARMKLKGGYTEEGGRASRFAFFPWRTELPVFLRNTRAWRRGMCSSYNLSIQTKHCMVMFKPGHRVQLFFQRWVQQYFFEGVTRYNLLRATSQKLVSFAAVIRVVTQRSSPLTAAHEALRDDPNNGCEGDYAEVELDSSSATIACNVAKKGFTVCQGLFGH